MSAATPQQENPLAAGLERLPVHPTAITIFGATGDLAQRKLLPALYNLAHDGALPERFNLIGTSRTEHSDDEFRELAANAIRKYSRRAPDERVLDRLLADVRYVAGSFDDPAVYTRLGEVLGEFDAEGGDPLNRTLYLSLAARFFPVLPARVLPGSHRAARRARSQPPRDRRRARVHREAVRHEPRGGRGAQPPCAERLRGAPGLPHRPLPGQGDGPERPGVPLRKRPLRAALEPQLHRPRPDHRGGGHRHRQPRELLRQRGRAARPRAEPHAPAPVPAVHGAAGEVHGRRGPRREGEG